MTRMNARRWWIASAAVVGVTAVAVPVFNAFAEEPKAPKSDDCEIEALSDNGGNVSSVSASGEYMAGTDDGEPTVWRDGEKIDLPLDELGEHPQISGVNSAGAVVGTGSDDGERSWIYQDGELTMLSADDYKSQRVVDINDDGQIIGVSWSTDDGMHSPDVALRWEPGETAAQELPLEDGNLGWVKDIDEAGNIVGHQRAADEEDPDYQPWIWDAEGNDHEVSGASEEKYSLQSVDREFALSDIPGEDDTQYYWDLTADGPFKVEELHSAAAIDVNGTLYGMVEANQPGFVTDGETTELPTLGGSEEHEVIDVSADGSTIVGSSADEDGNHRPVAWTCA